VPDRAGYNGSDLPFLDQGDRSMEVAVEAASFVLALRARGIGDTAVLRAMELVPREIFAPRTFSDLSRTDVALPLPCGQTMTAPRAVATMLVALGVLPGQHILEIGTGSGYVTALLVRLGARVTSVERFATLVEGARERLKIVEATGTATVEIADGLAIGSGEPFDRVILNGTLPDISETLTAHLAPGGRLVGAVTGEGGPRLVRIDRTTDGSIKRELGTRLRLSPLVAGVARTL